MLRVRSLLTILTASYVLYPCILLHAQKTRIYTYEDVDMKTGLDLFEKEKFGPAQHYFENIEHKTIDKNSLVRIDAEYYAAICAVELFNRDAEELLSAFIYSHPESPKVKMAFFNMGKYKYRKKQYDDAIEWFEKLELSDLDNEEAQEYHFKKGYSYFEMNNYEEASKELYQIKDVDNKYAPAATFYFSHIEYKNKNYETALKGFQKLVGDADFGSVVPYYIAQILYLQSKYDQVITYAPSLLSDSNDTKRNAEIAKIIAESFYRTSNYTESAKYFEKFKNYSGVIRWDDWYEIGFSYYQMQNYDLALEAFQKASKLEDIPYKTDTLLAAQIQSTFYHMADCYLKKNNKMLALGSFFRAYQIDAHPGISEDALFNYAKLSYELSFNPFSEAVKGFELYLKQYPNSKHKDEAYGYLVDVYMTTKNYDGALRSIESIKTLTPNLKSAYQKIAYYRGVQLFNDKVLADAIKLFDKSLQYPIDKNYNCLAKYWKGESYYLRAENDKKDSIDLEEALKNYKAYLFEPGAIDQSVFNTVNYSIGYVYFKQKKYADANTWFRKFVSTKGKEAPAKMNDAYLRIADGFFVMKDYPNATDYYNKVLEIRANDVDYALYQKAMVLGLQGKHEAKATTLAELLKDFAGKTDYEAAAQYEIARSFEMTNDVDKAYSYYNKVINEHPISVFVPNAMLQLGNIQNKKGQYDAALNTLNNILNAYPHEDIAKEAVSIIREVCKKKGDTDCLDKLKGSYGITSTKLDSDNFEIAKNYFFDEKFEDAYKAFSKYQQKFQNGIYLVDASFYKAEIDYKDHNLTGALGEYNYVIDKPSSKYLETSLAKAAWIDFSSGNFDLALPLYARLETAAEYPSNILDAKLGQMRCNFSMTKYDDAIASAYKVLAFPKLAKDLFVEAHMILAKAAFFKQDYDAATKEFNTVMSSTQNERSVEAKYNIALIQYARQQFKESQKTVFEIINQKPSYSNWLGKSFLLLSDDYIGLNDRYNAKYTLKTYIEKSTNAELVEQAKTKLQNIIDIENTELEEQKKKEAEKNEMMIRTGNKKDSSLFNEPVPNGGN